MTKEEQILKKYEEILSYKYSKANTKSKKKRILYDLCVLSELFSIYTNIDTILPWEQDKTLLSLLEEYNIEFSKHIIENKKILGKCFNNIVSIFKEINVPFYQGYQKLFKKIPQDITNEIIFSFLNEFDPILLKRYKQLLEEGKIFKCDQTLNCGYIFSLPTLNENIILPINSTKNNIYTSSILVHELGHLYETDMYNSTGNYRAMNMINKLPYYEVTSRFLEYCYLNYLKENNIYTEETERALHNYYIDLFMNAFNISIIYKMKNIETDEHDCVEIAESEVIEFANSTMTRFNLHSLETEKGDIIDFRESFIYGIGDIFSYYLYKNYREDPTNFKKQLKNTLLSYPHTKDIRDFERLGITEDKLISKKELKKILIK